MKTEHYRLDDLPEILNIKEAAGVLRITPLTLKRWGKRGILSPIRINKRGDRRYRKDAILKHMGIFPKLEKQL